jgi:hypothetical protein
MSFSRRMRRHAHRVAKAPRRGWQRTFRYQKADPGWTAGSLAVTPMSEDAPFGDQDARFWDWVLVCLIAVIVIGLIAWGISAI